MLISTHEVANLKQFLNSLYRLGITTEARYAEDILAVEQTMSTLIRKLDAEVYLRDKVERYKSQGFQVNDIINKRYSDPDTMATELREITRKMDDLSVIIQEYNRIKINLSRPIRAAFEAIMYKPEKHKEIKSMFSKISERS